MTNSAKAQDREGVDHDLWISICSKFHLRYSCRNRFAGIYNFTGSYGRENEMIHTILLGIDDPTIENMQDYHSPDEAIMGVERWVGGYYKVHPVDCRTYYATVKTVKGDEKWVSRTFIVKAKGRLTDIVLIDQLCAELHNRIENSIAAAADVVWRKRPHVEEFDASPPCEKCGHSGEPDWRVQVRCRICCSDDDLLVPAETLHSDGQFIPLWESIK